MSDDAVLYQMTKPTPIVWVHVVDPRPQRTLKTGETIEPAYEATFVFEPDHPDLIAIKKLMGQVAVGHTPFADRIAGNKAAGRAPLDGLRFNIENGTKLAEKNSLHEFARGKALLKAKSGVEIKTGPRKGEKLSPPRLKVWQDGKVVRYMEDHERNLAKKFFYSGVEAAGEFGFSAYTGMGGGVAVYLNEILSGNRGERINTGVDDNAKWGNVFGAHVGTVSSENPLDEEIPF